MVMLTIVEIVLAICFASTVTTLPTNLKARTEYDNLRTVDVDETKIQLGHFKP